MVLLSLLLPWLAYLVRGRIIQGIVCLVLQITLIGWLPATIWALIDLSNSRAEKRTQRIVEAIKRGQPKKKLYRSLKY